MNNLSHLPKILLCVIIASVVVAAGCSKQDTGIKKTPVSVSPGPPQFWDVGSYLKKFPLPDDVEDGFVEIGRGPLFSFGSTIAHKSISPRYHENHDMVVYIHTGAGRVHVGAKDFSIMGGDAFYVPRGAVYSVENRATQPIILFTVYSPIFDGKDIIYVKNEE